MPGKKNYTVKIAINDFFLETQKPKESKDNYCRWSQRFDAQIFKGPYKSIEELDRIYVYLMDGSEAVCFWKGLCSEFMN